MTTAIKKRQTITISINAKRFYPELIWILKARSTDKGRYALNFLNVDDYGFCATDGHRLHLCKNRDLLPNVPFGLWDVKILKDSVIFVPVENETFPAYLNIIPKYETEAIKINMDEKTISGQVLSRAFRDIVKSFNNCVNVEYLADLMGYAWIVKGDANVKDKAFHFTSGKSLEAIIMPLIG